MGQCAVFIVDDQRIIQVSIIHAHTPSIVILKGITHGPIGDDLTVMFRLGLLDKAYKVDWPNPTRISNRKKIFLNCLDRLTYIYSLLSRFSSSRNGISAFVG
ncbi:hypothetical protein CIHG_00569 [Coccidioides immitis H538.4]|uniref:Uncharacterized protein n=3 Tax=Coccidioides immitis TaxID=5501 RepID=A0A0J8TE90_COCIT|nr:hypothetical protein CIRG_07380 [Coccidioides immitis RMSCC 2394]KMU71847.1 hypothetical protein CISG_00157 [Coccidioides immitis RMSCC 3703]KMU82786.1 hypothetical protein CIHG_00569 [Coccidioides immitis H538.4]